MKWRIAWLAAGIAVLVLVLRAGPVLPELAARDQLSKGALLIDVRTVEEFNARHLTNAINIPLGELKETLPSRVPDKSRVLLLHCRSGRRSGIAERELREMGYTNAFNIGSFDQARKIVDGNSP
jgi:phage shock protein E